jgi:transposase
VLDQVTRSAILLLREQGHGTRRIAKALDISRAAVRSVVERGTEAVPQLARAEKAEPHRAEILELLASCKGNLVRVHEELVAEGATLSYQALTSFCRRHGIGHEAKEPVGSYHFEPGEEMQHDTSPHKATINDKLVPVETASLVFCHSRMLYFQHYPRFNRFTCKVFLHDAITFFERACTRCMIDNTHVVVLRGTGKEMVPVPEMLAFGERYGFAFAAHERGDPDRKGQVEKSFDFIEGNFLAGRKWDSMEQLNKEAVAWCDKQNGSFKRHLHAVPRELFAVERTKMKSLPDWLPEPYQLHHRIVDVEGYVSVHAVRYSAPYKLIGRRLEIRETRDKVELFEGPRSIAVHAKDSGKYGARVFLSEHRPPRGQHTPRQPSPDEVALAVVPGAANYVAVLKTRGNCTLALRRLVRMMQDYPRPAFAAAIEDAAHYGLYDLERVERMVLKNVGKDFFPTALKSDDDKEPDDDR